MPLTVKLKDSKRPFSSVNGREEETAQTGVAAWPSGFAKKRRVGSPREMKKTEH